MSLHEKKRIKRIKESVILRDGLICCYCNKILSNNTVTLEHIVPESKQGSFNLTNLTIACAECNSARGNSPFFEYCVKFKFSPMKLIKYKKLYFNNLKIKVLNIAKETCLISNTAIPSNLIEEACEMMSVNKVDFINLGKQYKIGLDFKKNCDRRRIKFCFEQLIQIINES